MPRFTSRSAIVSSFLSALIALSVEEAAYGKLISIRHKISSMLSSRSLKIFTSFSFSET